MGLESSMEIVTTANKRRVSGDPVGWLKTRIRKKKQNIISQNAGRHAQKHKKTREKPHLLVGQLPVFALGQPKYAGS